MTIRRISSAVLGLVYGLLAGCSLALPTDGVQCSADADCAFASQTDPHVCREQLCVPDLPTSLPVVIDSFYRPTGRLGDGAIAASEECPRRAGEARGRCHRFDLETGSRGDEGVLWARPSGAEPLRLPPGGRSVAFWAWTEGEDLSVRFGVGRTAEGAPLARSAPMLVGDRPRQYHVDLSSVDERELGSPFEWSVEGRGEGPAVALFVDDLVWTEVVPPAALIPNRRVYAHGEPIVLSYSGGGRGPTDWIGMYLWTETPGGVGVTSEAYAYTNGSESGSVSLLPMGPTYVVPELYKAGFWANDNWDISFIDEMLYVFVGPTPELEVRLDGRTAIVSYSNAPALVRDAIELFVEGEHPELDVSVGSQPITGSSASATFVDLAPGSYAASYVVHRETGFEATRRVRFEVLE